MNKGIIEEILSFHEKQTKEFEERNPGLTMVLDFYPDGDEEGFPLTQMRIVKKPVKKLDS